MNRFVLIVVITICVGAYGQRSEYHLRTIAFYNLENLFDTVDDPRVFDEDFTPDGVFEWTTERYEAKISNLAEVISGIGRSLRKGPPDIIGLCEVENFQTLSDLSNHPRLRPYDYGIIHKDGPDERGIDVALLYRKSAFNPVSLQTHRLLILNEERFFDATRDQLVVHGFMDGLPLYFIVNHWPSRRGGELRSRPHRIAAAELNLRIIDSILRITPDPMIISMGDFNDNPTDFSFKKVLKVKRDTLGIGNTQLFNPMVQLFRKGMGSLAYRDSWSLFDQILFSGNLINSEKPLKFWKAQIYDPSFLRVRQGPFKGYPLRTFTSGRYTGGYSDHFPVYAYFVSKVDLLLRRN